MRFCMRRITWRVRCREMCGMTFPALFLKIQATLGSKCSHSNPDCRLSILEFFPREFIIMQLGWMGCNLLSYTGSGNLSFSNSLLQLNSALLSLLIIECLGQFVVSGYLLPWPNYTPKCINIFWGIIFIDGRNYLPSQRIKQSGLELRDENI